FLAKMLTIDHPINSVIAKVGVDCFYQRVKLHRRHRPMLSEQMENCPFKYCSDWPVGKTKTYQLVLGRSNNSLELFSGGLGRCSNLSLEGRNHSVANSTI